MCVCRSETDNGISAQAQGTPRDFGGNPPNVATVIQGSFGWISDGKQISISYEADENGYRPSVSFKFSLIFIYFNK